MKFSFKNKSKLFIVSFILICTVAVGATVAFLTVTLPSLINYFNPSTVACSVSEPATVDGYYTVTNTGDAPAYLRVAVVPNWTRTEDDVTHVYYGRNPAVDVTLADAEKWTQLSDGFYYYQAPVAAGATVNFAIIDFAAANVAPTGYTDKSLHVLGEAIQAVPDSVLMDSWGVSIAQDGTFSKEGQCTHTMGFVDAGPSEHQWKCQNPKCGIILATAPHNYAYTVKDDGKHTGTCNECGRVEEMDHSLAYTSLGSSGHTARCAACGYESMDGHVLSAYTDMQDGEYHRRTCSLCTYFIESTHTLSAWSDNGNGTHARNCTADGCTFTETAEHHMSAYTFDTSTHTRSCTDCPMEESSAHVKTTVATGDTRTHSLVCEVCKNTYGSESHSWALTDTNSSYHYLTCSACGETNSGAHTMVTQSTTDAQHILVCDEALCNYSVTANHELSKTNNGNGTHTLDCTTVGCTYVATASHSYSWVKSTTNHYQICNDCGATTATENHSFSYLSNGITGHTKTCTTCGYSADEAHDGNPTCVCGYVALTYQKQFSMLSEDMQPVLANSNGNVYEESVLFIDDVSTTKNLLYPISQVLEVKFVDPNTGVVTYYNEGEHYTVSNGQISMISNSGIMCMPAATWNNWAAGGEGADLAAGKYWGEKDAMIKWQVRVTYKTNSTWTGAEQISYYNTKYANFLEKLRNGEDVTILFFGDSITWGANAAFNIGYKPEDGYSYSLLFTQALADLFDYKIDYISSELYTMVGTSQQVPSTIPPDKTTGSRGTIKYINTSVGGWTSANAASSLASHLCKFTNTYGCDLLIVAFGMNDTTTAISADGTASNVEHIVNHVKTDVGNGITPYPDAAVMLVSSMIPNPDSSIKIDYTGQKTQLSNLASQYTYTAHVDMTSISEAVYSKKGLFADYSGNNVNHPNDFLHRLYAQTLFEALIGYENIDKALSGEGADGTVERIGFHLDAHTIDGVDAVGDISIAGSQTLGLRGWVGYPLAITHYGYNIDGGPIFWTTESGGDTKDADKIIAAGGQYAKRFHIQTSMSGLSVGPHIVEYFVKLTDGSAQSLGALTPNVTSYFGPKAWTSLKTAGNLDGFTTNGNTGNLFPVANWNVASGTVVDISQSTSAGLSGWAAFSSVLTDVGYYWDSPSNGYTWQGSLGAETDSAVTASGGANARRFHVNAPMSSAPSNGVHTVHYVGKLSDGTIVEFESWVMNIG